MRGNRRSNKANFTSTLLPDTDQQHVHILKLHCIFLKLSDHIYKLILTTSNHKLNKTWCSVLALKFTKSMYKHVKFPNFLRG
jgi:hypothetical protein